MMDVNSSGKHSSLVWYNNNYGWKSSILKALGLKLRNKVAATLAYSSFTRDNGDNGDNEVQKINNFDTWA